jgi:ribose/xylose/arabinose/galactoside ABC-type transport system permease subunit
VTDLLQQVTAVAAVGIGGASLAAGALTLAMTRRPALALAVLLDLLLAAGLLRLAGNPGWQAIVTAAAIVVLRRLLAFGLRAGRRALGAPGPVS